MKLNFQLCSDEGVPIVAACIPITYNSITFGWEAAGEPIIDPKNRQILNGFELKLTPNLEQMPDETLLS